MSQKVLHNLQFKRWKERVESRGNIITNIDLLATISRNNNSILYSFLDCKLLTPEGNEIPRCVLLGGDSVVIVPVLTCIDNDEIYTMMIEQRRIIDGDFAVEFPSGSLENLDNDLGELALQELKEELLLSLKRQDIKPLANGPLKINPTVEGNLVYFFYFEERVTIKYLSKMNDRKTGKFSDGEYLRIKVFKMSEVADNLTSSALIGIKLLEKTLNCYF